MVTAERPGAVRRVDLVVAAVATAATVALVLSLPALDALDSLDDPTSLDQGGTAVTPGPTIGPAIASGGWWLVLVTLLVQGTVLAGLRRAPRALLAVIALLVLVPAWAGGELHGFTLVPVAVGVVRAALLVPLRRLWPVLVGAAVPVVVGVAVATAHEYGSTVGAAIGQGLLQVVGAVGLPLLVTLLVRSRRDVRTARLGEHEAQVDATLSRERAAMARELHDIAAHHLSGIALMAGVVDRQIDSDPARAHVGIRQVRDQSTAVLDDLRRLVGLLRADDGSERSVETLATVPALVDQARARGPITFRVLAAEPAAAAVGSGVGPLGQLAAFRTVQEALANAAMHAPSAPCSVEIDDRAVDHVTVTVRNERAAAAVPRTSTAGGFGLVGMRERAELVGAALQVGATDDGGWLVRLTLPRDGAPA